MRKCSVRGCKAPHMARGLCQMHYMRFRRANPEAPVLYEYGLSLGEKVSKLYQPGLPDECWLWRGSKNEAGYGRVPDEHGTMLLAHRAVWSVHHGKKIPNGMVLMHICDTPACVNPAHLKLGSQAENLRDMREKGRGHDGFAIEPIRGEAHHCANFTEDDVRAIRASEESSTVIAKRYGVHRTSIIKIRSRKTWKHID